MLWFIALPMPRVEEVHWKCGQCGVRWVEE
jgi:hypothetical protein